MQITKSEDCELNVLLWKKGGKLCIIIERGLCGLILEEKNVDDGFSGSILWFSINSHLFQKPKTMGK